MTCSDNFLTLLWMAQKSGGHHFRSTKIPSRELTYPTWGIGKSSSNMPFLGDMLVPWRVCYNVTMNSKTHLFYNLQRIVWLVPTTHHPHQQLRPPFICSSISFPAGNMIIDSSKEVVPTPGLWGWLRWVCSQSLTARFGSKPSDHVVELFQLGLWEAAERYLGLSFFSFMAGVGPSQNFWCSFFSWHPFGPCSVKSCPKWIQCFGMNRSCGRFAVLLLKHFWAKTFLKVLQGAFKRYGNC